MALPNRMLRISDEHWAALAAIAGQIVPDQEVAKRTPSGTSRVVPMMRMIAEGKLVVVRPEDLNPRAE